MITSTVLDSYNTEYVKETCLILYEDNHENKYRWKEQIPTITHSLKLNILEGK